MVTELDGTQYMYICTLGSPKLEGTGTLGWLHLWLPGKFRHPIIIISALKLPSYSVILFNFVKIYMITGCGDFIAIIYKYCCSDL